LVSGAIASSTTVEDVTIATGLELRKCFRCASSINLEAQYLPISGKIKAEASLKIGVRLW
jgi:hypothetical protein